MHAPVALVMVHGAAAVASKHAGPVSVVHHHDAVVFFGEVAQLRQRRNIAVHREHAVGDNQLLSRKICMLLEDAVAVLHIFVTKDLNRRFRKPRPVNNRRMVQFVGDDQIVFAEHGRNRSSVGRKSRLKHYACLHFLERRDLLFQLHVELHGTGNRANRSRADAKSFHRVQCRLAQGLVRGQPEVVV